jgi:hypothetical protein
MFESQVGLGVPADWVAKVKDGADVLKQARRLVDLTILRR